MGQERGRSPKPEQAQDTRAEGPKSFPLSQDGHYAQQSIQENFLRPALWPPDPLDTAAWFSGSPTLSQSTLTSSTGRQSLTGRSHLEGDWEEELSCW